MSLRSIGVGAGVRRMVRRERTEKHRASTPLELFFDLCFVVAVAQGGSQLAHAFAAGHGWNALPHYLFVFFGVWWAWMNFTWFASAYDTDDVPYRLATFVQITGALIFAAGVPRMFEGRIAVAVLGYVVMRTVMITQWLRVASASDGPERVMGLRYAGGIALCQCLWVVAVLLPHRVQVWVLLPVVLMEMLVPLFAERRYATTWHPEHVSERYGLFTLIVLGETVSAATVAVQSGVNGHGDLGKVLPIAAGGLLVCFSAWWIYFARPIHDYLRSNRQAFVWGYGHYFVFLSAAGIGAGLEAAVEHAVGEGHLSDTGAAAVVTGPTALFLFTVWAIHARHNKHGAVQMLLLPVTALAVLATTFVGGGAAVLTAGLLCAAATAVGLVLHLREDGAGQPG
ncbi:MULTISPECIES: low temperature requirement protein A [Streptacidiphilus]|uniref:Low temperature requirement protein A n=1 Tax=Streptacidiphilus cavernicola TaxID=3342716 RepID=A0ABV6UXH4_9ACTN|nr:low temperature requirement protein A [Streptacidiphilus jeojiense]